MGSNLSYYKVITEATKLYGGHLSCYIFVTKAAKLYYESSVL
jgi:hypothetical protein